MRLDNPFGTKYGTLELPDHTNVISLKELIRLADPPQAIDDALHHPVGCPSLMMIAEGKMKQCLEQKGRRATATIIISDNTRPVPYKGDEGILFPIVNILLKQGYAASEITILIATGTHRPLKDEEIRNMLDPRILALPLPVTNHNCKDESMLTGIGTTSRGMDIVLNRLFVEADLKIATGLVESHFMAGASGGRKAVCPGIIGEKGTYVFHSAELMADPESRDLNLENNPVHQEALEVAKAAKVDFIVNVTVDHAFHLTGVFAGELQKAHEAAVKHIKNDVQVAANATDVVITHAGFVGINHYQSAKCAVASMGILKKGGYLIIIADLTDSADPIGSVNYRTNLSLLTIIGPQAYKHMICSDSWTFIPEQWQVQQWAKVFDKIGMDHLYFYAPQVDDKDWQQLPGINGKSFIASGDKSDHYSEMIRGALQDIAKREGSTIEDMSISWIGDGPYVIPIAD